MALNKTKWLTLVIAIFFAILQGLQPFIHAHIDANHPVQETGFHMGAEHEELFITSNTPTVSVIPHASHIVSVASAIKQDIDPALFVDLIGFVLVALCFAIVLQSVAQYFPQLILVPPKSSSRRLPASRAPPQF